MESTKGISVVTFPATKATPSPPSLSTTDEETGSDNSSLGALQLAVRKHSCRHHQDHHRDHRGIVSSCADDGSASTLSSTVAPEKFILDNGSTLRPSTLQDPEVYIDEKKEDVNVILANVDRHHGHGDASIHDERLHDGTAKRLAQYLHLLILLPGRRLPPGDGDVHCRDEMGRDSQSSQYCPVSRSSKICVRCDSRRLQPVVASYRTKLESTRALQVTAACRALCLIVSGASTAVLEEQLAHEDDKILAPSALARNLLTSLPLVIQLLATLMTDASDTIRSGEGDLIDSGLLSSTSSCLVRFSGLNSALRIVQRVGPLLMKLPTASSSESTRFRLSLLVKALVSLLGIAEESLIFRQHERTHRWYVPPDLRVEAAIALTSLLPVHVLTSAEPKLKQRSLREPDISFVSKDQIGTTVISLLSTGARPFKDKDGPDGVSSRCVAALARLALWDSGAVPRKLLRRRCVVLALTQHLMMMTLPGSTQSSERRAALPRTFSTPGEGSDLAPLDLARALVTSCAPLAKNNVGTASIYARRVVQDNMQLLAVTVVRAVLQETRAETKIGLLEVLVLLIERDLLRTEEDEGLSTLPLAQTEKSVLNVLLFVASSSSGHEDFAVRAVALYLRALQVRETAIVVSSAVDLLSSPFPKVREQVFRAIMGMCFWKIEEAKELLKQSNLVDRLGYALRHGSKSDLENAVKVSKQLVVFHPDTHVAFCGDAKYVGSLVMLVTQEPLRRLVTYGDAVDVLLELMSVPKQILPFVPHDEKLLPWLVRLASRTSDDELKRRAGSTIIRYSTILLKAYRCG